MEGGVVLEVFEECRDRHACTGKHPRAAHAAWVSFNR
jgi:hypothetical protein